MFDRFLHPITGRISDGMVRPLSGTAITADQLSIAGFLVGIGAVPLLAFELYGWALAAILANRLLDGLDGAMARLKGATDRGAFLDIALDFVFYGAVPFGFALANAQVNALASAALLLSFIGTGSSFLALSIFAERRGLKATAFPRKGIFFIGGLAEGFETIVCFVAMCLLPAWYPVFAWIFAGICAVTAILRWIWGYRLLS